MIKRSVDNFTSSALILILMIVVMLGNIYGQAEYHQNTTTTEFYNNLSQVKVQIQNNMTEATQSFNNTLTTINNEFTPIQGLSTIYSAFFTFLATTLSEVVYQSAIYGYTHPDLNLVAFWFQAFFVFFLLYIVRELIVPFLAVFYVIGGFLKKRIRR